MSFSISTNTDTSPSITYVNDTLQHFNAYFIDMSDKSNNGQYNHEQPKTFYFTKLHASKYDAMIQQSKNIFSGINKKNCHRRCKNKYR